MVAKKVKPKETLNYFGNSDTNKKLISVQSERKFLPFMKKNFLPFTKMSKSVFPKGNF